MESLVSVIVPIYNVEPYLRQCVDSILNQTYQNLEIILVDDGTPDRCGGICDEYARTDSRVIVIHKKNGGQADARNQGLDVATGEYIAFIDSDDWVEPTYIETLMQSPADIVIMGYTFVNENGAIIKSMHVGSCSDLKADQKHAWHIIRGSFFGVPWSKLIRTSVIGSTRFESLPQREDFLFNVDVTNNATSIKTIDATGYFYRQRENSTLHHRYKGTVPELYRFPQALMERFSLTGADTDAKLGSVVIKIYLLDVLKKYIFQNDDLSNGEKEKAFLKLLNHKELIKYLRYDNRDTRFYTFLTFCMKHHIWSILYQTMRLMYKD